MRRGWVRSADLETDVVSQLQTLKRCNRTLYAAPSLLRALPADELLRYFGKCWRGVWRDFVANSMPYVCVRAWMAAGFGAHQFMLVRQELLRQASATPLLGALSNFTGLHYNAPVLHDKEEELKVHCEAPPAAKAAAKARWQRAAAATTTSAATPPHLRRLADHRARGHARGRARGHGDGASAHGERGQGGRGRGRGSGLRRLGGGGAELRPLVNSHSAYTGKDAERRVRMSPGTHAELERLARAHMALLHGLGLREYAE